MKKLLLSLLLTASVFVGCSSDEDKKDVCTNKIWNLTSVGENENLSYFVTYGETQSSAGTIQINQQTYNHFIELGNPTDGSICWEGTRQ